MLTPSKVLANKRYKIADSLIPNELRDGNILDIGCGEKMNFLNGIEFDSKYGFDKISGSKAPEILTKYDKNFFNIITMLAVLEHIDINKVESIFKEIYRILKPGGRFILTTPSPKSKWILKLLHWDEGHKKYYSIEEIVNMLFIKLDFYDFNWGYFELGYNQWLYADKENI